MRFHDQFGQIEARQAIVITTVKGDERAIGVIEMEITSQLVRRQFTGKAPILARLVIIEESNRQSRQAWIVASRFVERRASSSLARSRGLPFAST